MMDLCSVLTRYASQLYSFIRILLLQEAHGGGLMGHFDMKKIEDVLTEHFFLPGT